ncbi:MAG TPA: hypothetical protein VN259_10595, partial [Xanthomonadales bacterium]|nr:hypothetical protein [Xanthomonadales bacterium]
MFESVSSQTALFFGLLVGVLTTLIAALIWAQSALRRRQTDGAASRQAEIDALDLRAEDLAAALGHRESELLRERDRCQRLEAQLHLLMREHGELRGKLTRLDLAEATAQLRERELVALRAEQAESMAQLRALETRLTDEMRTAAEKLAFLGQVR